MGPILMIADDDADDVVIFKDLIKEIFEVSSQTYTLHTVFDGVELMKVLDTLPALPDVLFLDINMPLKNGMNCLREIKGNEKYKNMRVIMLSTSTFYAHVRLAYESGAELYIIKSHNLEKMKREIEAGIFFPMRSSILNYT